jgi:tRNA dimethylallyltransferase
MIAIIGPTASGKTALSLELARRFNGEIISADSRQIYRGMDIGTAKPTTEERRLVPHHLIDIKNPDEEYTVAEYKRDAIVAIRDILERGKLPILVGGTGLYVRAVVENLDIPAVKPNPELRRRIEKEIETDGLEAAFKRLIALDPEAAYVVDPKNPRRIVRALEVALTTGEPFTKQRRKNEPLFETLEIGVEVPPESLRARIDARVDAMITGGLQDEVAKLTKHYGADLPAFDAIGYRELINFTEKKITLDEAVAFIKLNTWHYAKRQITWFKKDKKVRWIKDATEAVVLVKEFLK